MCRVIAQGLTALVDVRDEEPRARDVLLHVVALVIIQGRLVGLQLFKPCVYDGFTEIIALRLDHLDLIGVAPSACALLR